MASIRKMENKNGISYQIQVKAKNISNNKTVVKCMTWRPDKKMSAKQIEREVVLVADNYEKKIKAMFSGAMSSDKEMEMTLGQYYEAWLNRRKKDLSINTYVHYRDTLKIVNEHIGGVKLKNLTPFLVQNFYDKLDALKKIVSYAKGKPVIKAIIKDTNLTRKEFAKIANVSENSILNAKKGINISVSVADRIAKALHTNRNKIFDIVIKKEPYAYETIHKHKRNLRAVLATAKKQRIIQDNYASAEYITFGRRPEKEIQYMNDEEAKIFYRVLLGYEEIKVKVAMMTILFTGMRRGELAGLNWEDIDFKAETINITRSYIATKGYGVYLKTPKTYSSKE